MRFALVSLAVATAFIACSTFSGYGQSPPAVDAGADVATDAGSCDPTVTPAEEPAPTCNGVAVDVTTDPLNCGACDHKCVTAQCLASKCEAEKIVTNAGAMALDGQALYLDIANEIQRADLTKQPAVPEFFAAAGSGTIRRLEVYNNELYVSRTGDQTILNLGSKVARSNEVLGFVGAAPGDGLFYPGDVAYYVFASPSGGAVMARIAGGASEQRTADAFLPLAHHAGNVFWTRKLTNGVQVFGPWEKNAEPIVQIGSPIDAFGVDGEDVFFAVGGFLSRASRGTPIVNVAGESGTGSAFAVSDQHVFYAAKRVDRVEKHVIVRVDKCRGGRPLVLFEHDVPIHDIAVNDTHVVMFTESGIYRVRR